MVEIPLPIGVDDFEKIRRDEYYYVDKTPMLEQLIRNKVGVNLYTRPRRFGKSLTLSMIRVFFEISAPGKETRSLFNGLKIMEADSKILDQQCRYPVIQLSLKGGKQRTFNLALDGLKKEISKEFRRHYLRIDSTKLGVYYGRFMRIVEETGSVEDYKDALGFLSEALTFYYGEPTIILIDEYDVPLENAYLEGFYDEMIGFVRTLFESALKTNFNLKFAIITGCLRISKESIFTGLNNLEMNSILSENFEEFFGFTPKEVEAMLDFYGLNGKKALMKEWYDGYIFGKAEVYNPWSVVNFVKALTINPDTLPMPYWSNTSSNSIVRRLVEGAETVTQQEIESLIEGGTIIKPVYEDITYGDIDDTEDNLWNFLYFTGYLKTINIYQEDEQIRVELTIPNREVRYIYKRTILNWFDQRVKTRDFSKLYRAILEGDTAAIEESISKELLTCISYYDSSEGFYHGFMLGILRNMEDYIVISNQESGKGRPDIIIKYPSVRGIAIIIEFKVTREYEKLETVCNEALAQIEAMDYQAGLYKEGYRTFIRYGIGFYKKECMVKMG